MTAAEEWMRTIDRETALVVAVLARSGIRPSIAFTKSDLGDVLRSAKGSTFDAFTGKNAEALLESILAELVRKDMIKKTDVGTYGLLSLYTQDPCYTSRNLAPSLLVIDRLALQLQQRANGVLV